MFLCLYLKETYFCFPPSFSSECYAASCVCKKVVKVKKAEVKELLPPTGSAAPEWPETCAFKSVTL